MRIRKLTLRNYRNIASCELTAAPGINFLIGSNGQGKTSVLEAIGWLSTLRSFRNSKSNEVILWDAEESSIKSDLEFEDLAENVSTSEVKIQFIHKLIHTNVDKLEKFPHPARKIAFINQKPIRSSTKFLEQKFGIPKGEGIPSGFHSIIFHPADHELIRGEPSRRRSYLDSVLSAESIDFVENLKTYQRALEQRNSLLKKLSTTYPRGGDNFLGQTGFNEFTQQLVQAGSKMALEKFKWLQRLQKKIRQIMPEIAPKQAPLEVFYQSKWLAQLDEFEASKNSDFHRNNKDLARCYFSGQYPLPSLETLEYAFQKKLDLLADAERYSGTTLAGPHRDDWGFVLDGMPLKGHGSQGEVRSTLLGLRLSEIEIFQSETGLKPILLLDDFSSELDHERRVFLLNYLLNMKLQVFVTTTEDFDYPATRFHVEDGNVALLDNQKKNKNVYDSNVSDRSKNSSLDEGVEERMSRSPGYVGMSDDAHDDEDGVFSTIR